MWVVPFLFNAVIMDATTVHTIYQALSPQEKDNFRALLGISQTVKKRRHKDRFAHIPTIDDYKRSIITGKLPKR